MNTIMENWSLPYDVGLIPFVFAPLSQPNNGAGLPNFLPFSIDVDSETGTMKQSSNAHVRRALERAYRMGSHVSGMMDSSGIGREYADDFIRFLKNMFSTDRFDGVRILEIGCGTGYLLYLLKNLGAEVTGIEPGPHGQDGSHKYDVPIVHDFFPSSKIRGQYDLVILYGVVEHIENPLSFIREVASLLVSDGKIALAVPDCSPYIISGDVSLLFHEHWNYYTQDTLKISILKAFGGDVYISPSGYGGLLYAIATTGQAKETLPHINLPALFLAMQRFCSLVEGNVKRLGVILEAAYRKDDEVGIYVPSRAINTLSMLQNRIKQPKLRFFDDNPHLYHTYYPGFPYSIESRNDFFQKPTKTLLIFSKTFGSRIKTILSAELPDLDVTVWEELFCEFAPVAGQDSA